MKYLYLLTLLIGTQLCAQTKIDTTWYNRTLDKYSRQEREKSRYKVKKEDQGKLSIHVYSKDDELESAFVLGEKEIANRKAEKITYLPNGKTRRVEMTWEVKMNRLVCAYYDTSDQLVGKATYTGVSFESQYNFKSGTEVKYFYLGGPKHIHTKKDGIITEEKNYYENGQLAEHFKLAKNLKQGVSTFYNPEGKEVGTLEYLYNTKRKRRSFKQGEKYAYNHTQLLGKAIIENGSITEKIVFAQPKNETIMYVGGQPFDGVEYKNYSRKRGTRTVYVEGVKTEETTYFSEGVVKSHMLGLKTVFYSPEGDTIAVGYNKDVNGRMKPDSGSFVKYFKNIGPKETIQYKDGVWQRKDEYQVSKDHTYTFLYKSSFNPKIHGKPYGIEYYSTGEVKYTKLGRNYSSITTTFNTQGDTIGVFDERKKEGRQYKFFGIPGYRDFYYEIEDYTKGRLQRFRKWFIPTGNKTHQDELQLLYDYDYKGEGKTYDVNGDVLYTIQMKDGKPFNGQWEEKQRYGGYYRMYTYVDGVKHGKFKEYRANRTKNALESTGTMINGKMEGLREYFGPLGLYKTENYVEGKRKGKVLHYKNGTVWKEELYDEKIAKSTVYDENGNVLRSLDYQYGRPYSGIGEKKGETDYKTRHFKYSIKEYKEGKVFKTYSYYNDKVYDIQGKQEGSSKNRVFFDVETNLPYADLTWNRYKTNKTDTVTYYNPKGKPMLMGQFRKDIPLSGHIVIQEYTVPEGAVLIHIVKRGDEITMNVFNSENTLLVSHFMSDPLELKTNYKAFLGRDLKLDSNKFALTESFQEFIQSKPFLKTYVKKYNGGL